MNPVQEVNDNLLDSLTEPTPSVDQMDFLRQKINSHQGPVGDFADALQGSAPQESVHCLHSAGPKSEVKVRELALS